MPCVYVLNKIDSITIQELDLLDRVRVGSAPSPAVAVLVVGTLLSWRRHCLRCLSCNHCCFGDCVCQVPHYVPISAKDEWNFDELLEKIWEYAKMIRM